MINFVTTLYNKDHGALQAQYNIDKSTIYLKIANLATGNTKFKYDWQNTMVVTVWAKSLIPVINGMKIAIAESTTYTYKYNAGAEKKTMQFGYVVKNGKYVLALVSGDEKRLFVFYDKEEAEFFVRELEKFEQSSLELRGMQEIIKDVLSNGDSPADIPATYTKKAATRKSPKNADESDFMELDDAFGDDNSNNATIEDPDNLLETLL